MPAPIINNLISLPTKNTLLMQKQNNVPLADTQLYKHSVPVK